MQDFHSQSEVMDLNWITGFVGGYNCLKCIWKLVLIYVAASLRSQCFRVLLAHCLCFTARNPKNLTVDDSQ